MNGTAQGGPLNRAERAMAEWLAERAVDALRAEVDLTPKPGLVDRRDNGAHADMSHALMRASAEALRPGFEEIAAASAHAARSGADRGAWRAELGVLGRASEARMLRATGGVNTHRGAIWTLGLLVAAAAARPDAWRVDSLLDWVAAMAAITDPAVPAGRVSNGLRVIERYGVAGARGEAMAGYPPVRLAGLPALRAARAAGASARVARLNTLVALMAVLDDTCVLSRAGAPGLATTRAGAAEIIAGGGVSTRAGARALAALDRALLARDASPGGSADLLAATLFIDMLENTSAGGESVGVPPAVEEPRHANVVA